MRHLKATLNSRYSFSNRPDLDPLLDYGRASMERKRGSCSLTISAVASTDSIVIKVAVKLAEKLKYLTLTERLTIQHLGGSCEE